MFLLLFYTSPLCIISYSEVFTVISHSNVLKNQWNLIEHFQFSNANTNVPEKTLIVNKDFSWRVLALNRNVTESMENVPELLITLESFLHLLDFSDRSTVCLGINDEKLHVK